jgi:hypothetical protein
MIATLVAAGALYAQVPSPGTQRSDIGANVSSSGNAPSMGKPIQFSSLDTDGDGRISASEIATHADLRSSFQSLDTDHDNYLSASEFGKWSGNGKSPSDSSTRSEHSASGVSDSSRQGASSSTSSSSAGAHSDMPKAPAPNYSPPSSSR